MKNTVILNYVLLIGLSFFTGCQGDFLAEKPQKSLLVPTTLSDFQAPLTMGRHL